MIVSILIPTRKRFDIFEKSINSLIDNCSNIQNFEVLVAIDNDDVDTILKIKDFIVSKPNIKFFLYERQFYIGLHNYYNDLASKASGNFLLLWNDDAIMKTINWDLEILKYENRFCVLNPIVEGMEGYGDMILFPIIPKKWVDITGEWAHCHGCDSWIDVLSNRLGLTINSEIVITHDRYDITGYNNDITYQEGRNTHNPVSDHLDIIEDHYKKLSNYLNKK
jgi:hypothetical protein